LPELGSQFQHHQRVEVSGFAYGLRRPHVVRESQCDGGCRFAKLLTLHVIFLEGGINDER
jgi:hypothetical protein